MQIERILRRWSFEAGSVLPADPEPFYRVAVRCGYKDSAAFEEALLALREAIRIQYLKLFGVAK
jgi:glutamine synthetase adenylyltransferase